MPAAKQFLPPANSLAHSLLFISHIGCFCEICVVNVHQKPVWFCTQNERLVSLQSLFAGRYLVFDH